MKPAAGLPLLALLAVACAPTPPATQTPPEAKPETKLDPLVGIWLMDDPKLKFLDAEERKRGGFLTSFVEYKTDGTSVNVVHAKTADAESYVISRDFWSRDGDELTLRPGAEETITISGKEEPRQSDPWISQIIKISDLTDDKWSGLGDGQTRRYIRGTYPPNMDPKVRDKPAPSQPKVPSVEGLWISERSDMPGSMFTEFQKNGDLLIVFHNKTGGKELYMIYRGTWAQDGHLIKLTNLTEQMHVNGKSQPPSKIKDKTDTLRSVTDKELKLNTDPGANPQSFRKSKTYPPDTNPKAWERTRPDFPLKK